ncbi:hypothetical protein M758_3G177700 [Ceratodon purpureus]|nr:hypothetical protein M758_3G177700 [Ceratodon purpureus]
MSGAEALVIGAVIGAVTNLVTNGINPLLKITRTAKRCEVECRKLEGVVESIKKDVEHILGQLEELDRHDPKAKQDLRILVNSVNKLKEELHLADIDMHKCNTAGKVAKFCGIIYSNRSLSKKITAHNVKITALGKELVQVNSDLTKMLNDARHRPCSSLELQHGASSQLQQQSSLDLQRWNREKDDILQREESTRQSQRLQISEPSLNGVYIGSSSSHY